MSSIVGCDMKNILSVNIYVRKFSQCRTRRRMTCVNSGRNKVLNFRRKKRERDKLSGVVCSQMLIAGSSSLVHFSRPTLCHTLRTETHQTRCMSPQLTFLNIRVPGRLSRCLFFPWNLAPAFRRGFDFLRLLPFVAWTRPVAMSPRAAVERLKGLYRLSSVIRH